MSRDKQELGGGDEVAVGVEVGLVDVDSDCVGECEEVGVDERLDVMVAVYELVIDDVGIIDEVAVGVGVEVTLDVQLVVTVID